jgi:hypothetical protein
MNPKPKPKHLSLEQSPSFDESKAKTQASLSEAKPKL